MFPIGRDIGGFVDITHKTREEGTSRQCRKKSVLKDKESKTLERQASSLIPGAGIRVWSSVRAVFCYDGWPTGGKKKKKPEPGGN